MATARDRMVALLGSASLCDDCVAERLGFKQRQQANMIGRELELARRVRRERARCGGCGTTKILNRDLGGELATASGAPMTPGPPTPPAPPPSPPAAAVDGERPWSWEGNVQARIVEHLRATGWEIERTANTASRETGIDVVARHEDGRRLWISVKGYPEKSQNVQARHWFAGAIFDLIVYRSKDADVELAIGLPDGYSTFKNLLPKVAWARTSLPFSVYWVAESGEVRAEGPPA